MGRKAPELPAPSRDFVARRAIACALKLVSGASLGQAIQDGKLVEWATFLVRSDGCTVLAYQTHTSFQRHTEATPSRSAAARQPIDAGMVR